MTFQTRRLSRESSPPRSPLSAAAPFLLRIPRAVFGWYGRWKQRQTETQSTALSRVARRSFLGIIVTLLVILVLGGTVRALVALQILTPQRFLQVAGTDLPADENGFTNFLLLGSGDKDHDGVDLTDSMMIVSIDPGATKSVSLLSLPRDLYAVRTEKMGRGRINSLYRDYKWYLRQSEDIPLEQASQEALKELARELGNKLGVQIHHIVKIDFTAFVEVVDAVGGIDIEVPEALFDTEYPAANGYGYETFSIAAGLQHFDGATALKYARSRHSTSDFDRGKRQQQLLQALADKAQAEGIATSPGKITALLKILSEHVETTMNFGEILGAGKLVEKIERQNVISVNLSNEAGYGNVLPSPGGFLYSPPMADFGGASVLLPLNIGGEPQGSWRQLRAFTHVLLHSRSVLLARPQIFILNAGAKSGLARTLGYELSRFGFPVSEMANLSDTPSDASQKRPTSTVIAKVEQDESIAQFFGSLLQMPAISPAPIDLPMEKLGQITVVLGEDYVFTPMQELVPSEDAPETGSGSTLQGSLLELSSDSSDSLAHRSFSEGGSASSDSSPL